MRTIGDPREKDRLTERVRSLSLASERRWGKMNVQQMLTHLAGGMELVLYGKSFGVAPSRLQAILKFIALKLPVPWPKGAPNPLDPASVDVPESEFEDARRRAVAALEAIGSWEKGAETPAHPGFGDLTTREWQRWAYKHADHHLKQFSA
jgi:hypothetical protein